MSMWQQDRPIYRQLRDRVESMIIDGSLAEGTPVPSVRQVSKDEKINPLTVSRAYQLLVDEGMLESRRGLGMYVTEGAAGMAQQTARERFINEEWPEICRSITRLGLSVDELLEAYQRSQ